MLVGLTGNFGSGKSTLLKLLGNLGAVTIDSDEIVKKLYDRDDIVNRVVAIFGTDILDSTGKIDKSKVANIIFHNNSLRSQLEAILHPYVFSEIETLRELNRDKIVVAEIPLLFEAGYESKVDTILLTKCSRSTSLKRLRQNGYSEDEVMGRLSCQMQPKDKEVRSEFIINTDRGLKEIEQEIKQIYTILSARISG